MRWGQIGGLLIIGGGLLFSAAVVTSAPRVVTFASLVLLGSGAGVLSFFGPRPLHGRGIRIGLGAIALGLLSFLVTANVPISAGSNDLESWPYVISALVGLVATILGFLVLAIGLVRTTGPARAVGSLFVAGLLLQVLPVPLRVAPILLVLGVLGIAVLAIRGERSSPDSPA
jgi:hypothetical protein